MEHTPQTPVTPGSQAGEGLSIRRYFTSALARPGRKGTLHHRLLRGPARQAVLGKTGTTDDSSALSGK